MMNKFFISCVFAVDHTCINIKPKNAGSTLDVVIVVVDPQWRIQGGGGRETVPDMP